MRMVSTLCSVPLIIAALAAEDAGAGLNRPGHGVAYFEPPRSIGTPIDDVARSYTGRGLADRIAGRLRLDTDAALPSATRELIRRRLTQESR